jgi:hypothetical protein
MALGAASCKLEKEHRKAGAWRAHWSKGAIGDGCSESWREGFKVPLSIIVTSKNGPLEVNNFEPYLVSDNMKSLTVTLLSPHALRGDRSIGLK